MKRFSLKPVVIGAITVAAFSSFSALECQTYFPMSEGAEFEIKTYNEKEKLQSVAKHKVTEKKVDGNTVQATVQMEAKDEKDRMLATSTYVLKCEDGTYKVDMRMMVDPNQAKSMEGMETKVESDYLEIPANPTVGQELKGGDLTMTMGGDGMNVMSLRMNISNRKVDAIENVTTPAGTFECVKITYDVETTMLFAVRTKAVEWYAKDVGMVQSKTYNSKGKLLGYSQLSSIKK